MDTARVGFSLSKIQNWHLAVGGWLEHSRKVTSDSGEDDPQAASGGAQPFT
jgi:hypothetical protein